MIISIQYWMLCTRVTTIFTVKFSPKKCTAVFSNRATLLGIQSVNGYDNITNHALRLCSGLNNYFVLFPNPVISLSDEVGRYKDKVDSQIRMKISLGMNDTRGFENCIKCFHRPPQCTLHT